MKRIYSTSILMAAALTASSLLSSCHKSQSASDEAPEIEVAKAFTDSITLYKTFPGTITSSTTANVVARVNGRLLSSSFQAGSHVDKGQVLYHIDPTTYADAVESARSALATARSQYDYYSKQYAAMTKALEADAVSKMEVLEAQSNMEKSQAAIQQAQAQLSTAMVNLNDCTVRAPISGYITVTRIDPGNYVSGESQPVVLATIYDNDNLTATFSLSDSQYEQLVAANGGIGASVYRQVPLQFRDKLTHQYYSDLTYEAPSVDQSTGTVLMQGSLKNIENELKNGMYVTVSLPYGSNPKAVLVKDASIASDQLGKYLYTVDTDNKVAYTPIEVGDLYHDSLRVVTSGIEPGTAYVTKALLTVRQGETINPVLTK